MKRGFSVLLLLIAFCVPGYSRIRLPVPEKYVVLRDYSIDYKANDQGRKKKITFALVVNPDDGSITRLEFRAGHRNYFFPKCIWQLLQNPKLSSVSIESWWQSDDDYEITLQVFPTEEDGKEVTKKTVNISMSGGRYVGHSIYLTMSDCSVKSENRKCEG
jgi:hypothetical protein